MGKERVTKHVEESEEHRENGSLNKPRIAKARAAALFTRSSVVEVKRIRSSRRLSEVISF